jgi:hypothetical protein
MSDRVFSELLYGEGAHADPTACIEDLRADAAGRTIDGFPHSIWPLVSHTDYWIDYEIKRIADEAPPYPQHAALSWPVEVAPASEKHWSETKLNFSVLLRRLADLAQSPPESSTREVKATHPGHAKVASSLQPVLLANLGSQQLSRRTNRHDAPLFMCLASSRRWR